MKRSNLSFLLGWFIVGFAIAYILLNSSKWANIENAYTNTENIYDNKLANIETRQNSFTSNYVRLPSYKRNTSHSYWSAPPTINESENSDKESNITAEYAVNIDNKSIHTTNTSVVGYSAINFTAALKSQTYSSQKNENSTNSNGYSGLSQAINQLADLNNNKSIKIIQGSSENVKSNHGFLTISTNLTSINSSISMSQNGIQKVDGDPGDPGAGEILDPGAGGEMGEPIPVGDGWMILLMLAIGYAGLKRLRIS
ncbi:MAG: hypothetical protein WCJ61_17680 [Paludibacter sp.]